MFNVVHTKKIVNLMEIISRKNNYKLTSMKRAVLQHVVHGYQ